MHRLSATVWHSMRRIDGHAARRYVQIGEMPKSGVRHVCQRAAVSPSPSSSGDEGADDLVNWMVTVEATRSDVNEVMIAWHNQVGHVQLPWGPNTLRTRCASS